MQLLCADTDLCTKAKFKAIGKAGRSIDIYGSCVDFIQKTSLHLYNYSVMIASE